MFTVPIVPPDLRHEETIIQAAYALDSLQNTINTIFRCIDNRIEQNNAKVGELQSRIKKSQEKIKSLQGTRKAIHIYAPARFPANHVFKDDIPVTFKKSITSDEVKGVKNATEGYEVKSKIDLSLPSINEKLVFFHVRETDQTTGVDNNMKKERLNIKQVQDLGVLPNDLRSVASVLLFNSEYSPYSLEEENAEKRENWKRAKLLRTKRNQKSIASNQTTSKHVLEPAPHSLAHRNEKLTPSGGLKYTPKLIEAPELDLPWDLPDLQGIADDLRFEGQEAKQKIAPSLGLVVESLPDLDQLMQESAKGSQTSKESNVEQVSKSTADKLGDCPPPPPPPPPQPAPMTSNLVPPPPPPLPPAQKPNISTANSAAADSRSELMAAIRNAGGMGKAPLKRAAAPITSNNSENSVHPGIAQNTQQRKNTPSPGGDLMTDLHNKLLMRRKGISGAKENQDNVRKNESSTTSTPSGNPVISRLSSLIPPPVARTKIASEDEDDDSNDADWVD
ncbi:WASH complex subunit 1 [Stomoxys calcitrans]|uniref:WASH complex subunit 1 n=1 Tax=Stomoxys calcitrans TaxID=35570 RepID=UPI0027E32FDC|nr:WASH complex subunit 1 [Stomoxys calcitrans]